MTATSDVHQLLTGAGEVLDRLRHQEKDLEALARVRGRLAAGEAVLAAVERWQSLTSAAADQAAPAVLAHASPVPVAQPPLIERIALLLAQDPALGEASPVVCSGVRSATAVRMAPRLTWGSRARLATVT
ncbi:hypothetical protein ABZ656_34110 [Streptomyces sp. NPDC007095]|uniref:hypothetical protein n=1 Tax=Streptomyces sp. NPDC007095 TaxID=3154482 RepID=UPI0033F3DD65